MRALTTIATGIVCCVMLNGSSAFAQVDFFRVSGQNATFDLQRQLTLNLTPFLDCECDAGFSYTFDLFVTTGSDIEFVQAEISNTPGENVDGGWYNSTVVAKDHAPPAPALINIFPDLAADTWFTVPGDAMLETSDPVLDPPPLVSVSDATDDSAQNRFHFGRVTLLAGTDDKGVISLTQASVRGVIQTASSPTPILDEFEYFISVDPAYEVLTPTFADFESGFPQLSGRPESVDEIFTTSRLADPWIQHDATVFAPTDASRAAWETLNGPIDLDDLIVDDPRAFSGPRWGLNDLTNLVPDGGSATLVPLSGNTFEVTKDDLGRLTYGGATIIATQRTYNGWVHVLDDVPIAVPEPGAIQLLVLGLLSTLTLRFRQSKRNA